MLCFLCNLSSTDSTERVPQMLIGLQLKQNASEDLTLLHFRQTVKEKPGNPCLAQGLRGCLGSLACTDVLKPLTLCLCLSVNVHRLVAL